MDEIVQKEEKYLGKLNVPITLYFDDIFASNSLIMGVRKKPSFMKYAEAVKKANEGHLLSRMKYPKGGRTTAQWI